jgi:capsular exopolysaccharide synthesis family protein
VKKPIEFPAEPAPSDRAPEAAPQVPPGWIPTDVYVSGKQLSPLVAAVLSSKSMVAEEFRILRAKVRAIGEKRPFRCVGLVSASGGEGKTTVALGLASAMAQEPDRRILLIEADARKPSIESYLGLPRAEGLWDWLEGKGNTLAVRRLIPQGFSLLSAGNVGVHRPELLASDRMLRLLEAARRFADFVIVDAPPLGPVADSVILQDLLDGFLLVVRARTAPLESIRKSVANLKPDRIQGVVWNDHKELLKSYYGYSYKGYGPER